MKWCSDSQQERWLKMYYEQKSEEWERSLLDSSLITATLPFEPFNCKVYELGNFVQVFYSDREQLKTLNSSLELDKPDRRGEVQKILNSIPGKKKIKKEPQLKKVQEKNINRAKNEMCRLILANNDVFKTFITLTYKFDINDLDNSNKELHKFVSKVRRCFKDFKYLCVPEFTKKNRIHYHMITNIDYNNVTLINENMSLMKLYNKIKNKSIKIYTLNVKDTNINKKMNDFDICLRYDCDKKIHNTKCTFNFKSKKKTVFKTVKYWNNGFSNIQNIKDICENNIVGYLSKYMTKDIDERLFGFRKYTYSLNLNKPKVIYLNLNDKIQSFMLEVNYLQYTKNIRYTNSYQNKFRDNYNFIEFEKLT